jgi:long-chain acyl-CoA synthetase
VEALYAGAPRGRIATDITYEDGRKGRIEADLEIRDVAPAPVPAARGAAA